MFRTLVVLQVLLVGCSNIGLSAWNETSISCPDSDYDNGGSVEPQMGYCKSGRGFFLSYERKIK